MYDPNVEYIYYVQLKNRQYLNFSYSNWEVSATTIPLKFRFAKTYSGTTNGVAGSVYSPTALDLQANIGANFQRRWGHVRYIYDKYGGMTSKTTFSGVLGVFASVGSLPLSKTNTKSRVFATDQQQMGFDSTATQNVPSISLGISGGVNIYGIEIGAMVGWEIAMEYRQLYDYRKVPFIGFGIGYGIGFVKDAK
jgi:hypothetical protein